MMLCVVDPTEPQRDPSSADDARLPEVVDAEVVEETSTPAPADPRQDDAESRQYQQFLEFQKFQEWQRQHGTQDATSNFGPPQAERKRPPWKRIMHGLAVIRRLIYIVVLLLVAITAYNFFYGGGGDNEAKQQGGNQADPQPSNLPLAPKEAIIAVHDYLATEQYSQAEPGKQPIVCLLFDSAARASFANAHNAPDCASAAMKLNQQVTDPMGYKNPGFSEDAMRTNHNPAFGGQPDLENDAVVYSCRISADGGPRLGDFGLHREPDGGWIIDGYQFPPTCSP